MDTLNKWIPDEMKLAVLSLILVSLYSMALIQGFRSAIELSTLIP